ncbi:MAG TPA: hypothetical protein VGP72_05445 [Planctomycetota bacterium]|jgi:hypothetical protein
MNVNDAVSEVVIRMRYSRTGRISPERAEDILDRALMLVSISCGRPMRVRPHMRVIYRVLALQKRLRNELFKLGGHPGSDELYGAVVKMITNMLEESTIRR